jgi:hypothetical protein
MKALKLKKTKVEDTGLISLDNNIERSCGSFKLQLA